MLYLEPLFLQTPSRVTVWLSYGKEQPGKPWSRVNNSHADQFFKERAGPKVLLRESEIPTWSHE